MDVRLLIFLWIANCVGVSVANQDFLQEVRRGFEHGRKISGWNSRASWIRQVKGTKRSPSIRELEKWWKGPLGKQKGNWKPETDFWLSSPQTESAANGFVPLYPTKGWREPKKLKPLSIPRLKFPRVNLVKPLRVGRRPNLRPLVRRPPKSWTPRKMKEFLPQLKHVPKIPHHSWVPPPQHRRPNKDYVPLMKMKDLIPKTAESWPSINKCWPPTSFASCDPFNSDDASPGQNDGSSLGHKAEAPIATTFFTAFNEPPNEVNNEGEEGTKSWDSPEGGVAAPLTESWNSLSSGAAGPAPGPAIPLNDINEQDGSPLSKQIWPSFNYINDWTPAITHWTTGIQNTHNNDDAPLTKDWEPISITEGVSHVGADSFSGWQMTNKGWTAPQSYNSWTPVSSNGWTALTDWSPPQNTWLPPSYPAWIPPTNDWSPMAPNWPSADPTPLHVESTFQNEPISITSTENPILGEPVTNSIPYWESPSSHQWTKMTSNWAKEIKGLINQVTHGIF